MITSMCSIICVTSRKLCTETFLLRLAKIAASGVTAVVLREKDMQPDEYRSLALQARLICEHYGVPCILHSFADIAAETGSDSIHLSIQGIRDMTEDMKKKFSVIGVSVHSADEAAEAERLGATYITAGHIFPTDCKKGLPPRGLDYLKEICSRINIPVYGIGGIDSGNYCLVESAGAAGACVMSGLMTCDDPAGYIEKFRKESGE